MKNNKPRIHVIAGVSQNNVIGCNGTIPWVIPSDLRRFREMTYGYPVIMGRKTFESIGNALPGRRNIVITSDKDYNHDGIEVVGSLSDAIELCRDYEVVFVIGGQRLYAEAVPIADAMIITHVHAVVFGDTFFPIFDKHEFLYHDVYSSVVKQPSDEFPYTITRYDRKVDKKLEFNDGEIREIVNKLRDTAVAYADTQQLRARIQDIILPYLTELKKLKNHDK